MKKTIRLCSFLLAFLLLTVLTLILCIGVGSVNII